MSFVSILRELWAQRLFVAVGLVLALTTALLMAFSVTLELPPTLVNRQYQVGVASASVLVDSPKSQVADLGGAKDQTPADVESLSARARLLGNLMATSPLKDQIAVAAGIRPDHLIAHAPSEPGVPAPSASQDSGTTVRESDPLANILRINVNESLPILSADAQAPTPAGAAKISSAAVTQLETYLSSVSSRDRVPNARQLVIKRLGPAQYSTVRKGPRRLFAAAAFLFVLGAWCAGIIVVAGLARGWRQASEAELLETADEIFRRDPTGPAPPPPPTVALPPPELRPEKPQRHDPRRAPPERPERPERPAHRRAKNAA